jgi:hypothetical protein
MIIFLQAKLLRNVDCLGCCIGCEWDNFNIKLVMKNYKMHTNMDISKAHLIKIL